MFKYLKYLNSVIFYILAYFAFSNTGWFCWSIPIFAFCIVPLIEIATPADNTNLSMAEEELAKKDRIYDFLLYTVVFLQIPTVVYFLIQFKHNAISNIDIAGRIISMGILCGTYGINVGHELGHRKNKGEQFLAKISLMTSLYMHFFIEHNKGHHKNVATPKDPSSTRYNEMIYMFFPRTILFSYISAWHIANAEVKKIGKSIYSIINEMIQIHIVQFLFLGMIYYFFGGVCLFYFMGAAAIGILLLESVNYIEHYGLQRKQTTFGNYERTLPQHSWNSNHVYGRLLLFELSRHSDHHYLASKKYQTLQHHENAPQLPTGYPGSILLALLPPLWFRIMNKKINGIQNEK